MIDIHSHILYGVDDGAAKIEDSIRMLSEAEKVGIKYIISTTHYHNDLFEAEKTNVIFRKLATRAADFGITLQMGYEVYMTERLIYCSDIISRLTLNNSKYLLIEFPFSEFPKNSIETLYKFYKSGIIPVISHPERSRHFIENVEVLNNFIESGFLIQIDAASILGVYGRRPKLLAKDLLMSKKVSFVASNAHFADDYNDWYLKAYYKIRKLVGEDYSNELFKKNGELVVNSAKSNLFIYSNA